MSRKMRTPAPRAVSAAGGVTPEAEAGRLREAGRYREAIERYKNLLKQERRPEWVDGLAASYAGRAGELADKGMLPEALVVWRNRSTLCNRPLAEGPYLEWLLRAGEHDAALRLLSGGGALPAPADADLEMRLAAVALTAPDSALAQLAADSPLRRHRAPALAALAACGEGDAAALDEQLRAIPFRSPYRDLRFILKALVLVGDDPRQAAGLIARVAVGGPFEKLAAVVRAAVLPGSGWLSALLALDGEGRQLLLEIKGCPESRRSLLLDIAELANTGAPLVPARVVDLLLRRSRGLPATAARLCRRLLPYADKRLAEYATAFTPLGQAEGECILALAAEIQEARELSERRWLHAAERLATRVGEGERLQAALILRQLCNPMVGDQGRPAEVGKIAAWLARSLQLDPDDRATHLKLIALHRRQGDLRAARAALETALARFDNDPAVLLEAVETALAGNAFKKGVTLAKRLLELDPINSKVRHLIGQAHLSHARKQIRAHRPEAVGRELDLADEWLVAADERSIAKLLRGLSATDAPASELLRQAVAELGGRLLAAWHLLLETFRVGKPSASELRRAAVDLSGTPGERDVLAVVRAINTLGDKEKRALRSVLDTLRAPLKRAADGNFSEAERVTICETLLRRDERTLLRAYAEIGLRRWPGQPLFVYLTTFAKYGATARFTMSEREQLALEAALDKALADGDERTVLRIRELIAPQWEDDPDGDDFDDDTFAELGKELFENPSALFEAMISIGNEQGVIDLAREVLPDGEFRRLERAAGGDRKTLARMLIDCLVELHRLTLDGHRPPGEAAKSVPAAPRRKPAVENDRQKGLFDD